MLIALAQTKDRNAEGVIRSFIDSEESRVRDDASLALCVFHGLADPLEVVFGLEREVGFDKLTKAQKYVSCIYGLKGEVENGGLSQYFFNSTGDYVSIAMEGIESHQCSAYCDFDAAGHRYIWKRWSFVRSPETDKAIVAYEIQTGRRVWSVR